MNILYANYLLNEAKLFCEELNNSVLPELFGVTDGKAIGTLIEHKFKKYLANKFYFTEGNSAQGIDLPDPQINTDIKVTYINQPQSSCPFKSARQKIFGLGYNLLVFVYDRVENNLMPIKFLNVTFISAERTGDYTTTKRLIEMKKDGASKEDIIGYLNDRGVPGDEVLYEQLSEEIINRDLYQGVLTISNALQWRLQYSRAINLKNKEIGVKNYDFK